MAELSKSAAFQQICNAIMTLDATTEPDDDISKQIKWLQYLIGKLADEIEDE